VNACCTHTTRCCGGQAQGFAVSAGFMSCLVWPADAACKAAAVQVSGNAVTSDVVVWDGITMVPAELLATSTTSWQPAAA